ncbi:MAG: hypothetical protein GX643_17200 [Acidimicrobiales bacterium]|nr:hypothetical protein [Acidimicrobiales bacterium]
MDQDLVRILADEYMAEIRSLPLADLRALRNECQHVETQLSYLRRLVQGRHDIATGEIERRRGGGSPDDVASLVERLPTILADRIHAPGSGRLPSSMEPGEGDGRLFEELEAITEAASLDAPDQVTDGDLARAAEQLAALELEVSSLRRQLFDRIDTLQAELTRRYRDGETTVEDLLAGSD